MLARILRTLPAGSSLIYTNPSEGFFVLVQPRVHRHHRCGGAVRHVSGLGLHRTRLRLVTARFLWTHLKYAIFVIFIAAALLTASPDWWNQVLFALPMAGLYLVSIVIAWMVGPKGGKEEPENGPKTLGLVIAAAAFDCALRS